MIGSRTVVIERLMLMAAAILILILAVVQYQWTGKLSRAERDQLARSLENRASGMAAEVERQLAALFFQFHPQPTQSRADLAADLSDRWQRWQEESGRSALLQSVFFVASDPADQLSVLDIETGTLQDRRWDHESEALRSRVAQVFASTTGRHPARDQSAHLGPAHPRRSALRSRHRNRPRSSSARPQQWLTVAAEVPALISPVIGRWQTADRDHAESHRWLAGLLILVLDQEWMVESYLPQLTERFFDRDEYQVAIWLQQPNSSSLLFHSSDSAQTLVRGDLEIRMLDRPLRDEPKSRQRKLPIARVDEDAESSGWRLVVAHREGSLDRAVSASRRRNVGLSALVFILLSGAVLMLAVLSRRARDLAQQQTDFVAGMTHELRTPIASISSLAENLADGIVIEPERTQRYGELIKSQGRRLAGMVDHVLEVAGMGSAHSGYQLLETDLAEVVHAAVGECRSFADERGVTLTIDTRVESQDRATVLADERALRMAVVNLVTNAIKYGGEHAEVGVSLHVEGGEAVIAIEDSGWGIPDDEHSRIFEPFVRGRQSTERQIEGSGLGLVLAQRVVASHNGRIELQSVVDEGSRFSIHLPIVKGE